MSFELSIVIACGKPKPSPIWIRFRWNWIERALTNTRTKPCQNEMQKCAKRTNIPSFNWWHHIVEIWHAMREMRSEMSTFGLSRFPFVFGFSKIKQHRLWQWQSKRFNNGILHRQRYNTLFMRDNLSTLFGYCLVRFVWSKPNSVFIYLSLLLTLSKANKSFLLNFLWMELHKVYFIVWSKMRFRSCQSKLNSMIKVQFFSLVSSEMLSINFGAEKRMQLKIWLHFAVVGPWLNWNWKMTFCNQINCPDK